MKIPVWLGRTLLLIGVLLLVFGVYPALWWLVGVFGLDLPISFGRVWFLWLGTVVLAGTGWAIIYLLSEDEKPRLTKGRK